MMKNKRDLYRELVRDLYVLAFACVLPDRQPGWCHLQENRHQYDQESHRARHLRR